MSTRNEASLETILSSLTRVETKLNDIRASKTDTFALQNIAAGTPLGPRLGQDGDRVDNDQVYFTETEGSPEDAGTLSLNQPPIPFSAHQVLSWPAVRDLLPEPVTSVSYGANGDYSTRLELDREPLTPEIKPHGEHLESNWLMGLSFSVVKELADAYFSTFNLVSPLIDRTFFFHNTLGVVLNVGFGYNMETCLVLIVMALGCLGIKFRKETKFEARLEKSHPRAGSTGETHEQGPSRELTSLIDEEIVGLRFFNESRKRIGYLNCENSLQSSQYYLLSAYDLF